MPSIIVQGRTLEISEIDYFEVWYNFSENFLTILSYFSIFPDIYNFGKRELEVSTEFILANMDYLEDGKLRDQVTNLLEIMRPIPEAHARMVQDVIEQLGIKNPHSPYGKRQITAKWKKLIAGQTPTDEMKNASATLQIYYEWISGKYQEIAEKKYSFSCE